MNTIAEPSTKTEPSVEEFDFIDSGGESTTIDSSVPSLPAKPIEGIEAELSVEELSPLLTEAESPPSLTAVSHPFQQNLLRSSRKVSFMLTCLTPLAPSLH